MNQENKKGGILKKLKKTFIVILVAFMFGLAVGYYFGYDIGFEKAVRILTK